MRSNIFLILCFLISSNLWAKRHTIRAGESLMTISNQHYQTHQCWKLILSANTQLKNANDLQVGKKLSIPPIEQCPKRGANAKNKKFVRKKNSPPNENDIHQELKNELKKETKTKKLLKELDKVSSQIFEDEVLFEDSSSKPKPIKKKNKKAKSKEAYKIQFASFNSREEAESLARELAEFDIEAQVEVAIFDTGKTWFRVRTYGFASRKEAKKYAKAKQINYLHNDYLILKDKTP